MLRVYNVGQGDSMLFFPFYCKFLITPLLVDVGPKKSKANITQFAAMQLSQWPALNIMITHSHSDHMGALSQILTLAKSRNSRFTIDSLYIPYYMPEISQIYFLLSKAFRTNRPSIQAMPKVINRNIKVIPVYDGYKLCDKSLILNPPKDPSKFYYGTIPFVEEPDGDRLQPIETLEDALNILLTNKVIEEKNVPLIEDYASPLLNLTDPVESGYGELAKTFVSRFFVVLANAVQVAPAAFHQAIVSSQVQLSANQASIVFRHEGHSGLSWLYTGDADEYVFERLIQEGKNIRAEVLKVPHHGSKENMSLHILNSIRPRYAIISHKNRRFNRSEPHPHLAVIDMLERSGAKIYYTNDVIKPGVNVPIRTASSGTVGSGLIEFI